MGHMDVIPIISSGFNVYFPLCLIVLCVSTYLRLGTRLLHYIGFEQFMHNDADGLSTDLVNDGRQIVQRGTHSTVHNTVQYGYIVRVRTRTCTLCMYM